MRRLKLFVVSLFIGGALVGAHEGNEHVRGVVTQVSAQSITVQTTDTQARTLALTAKTTFQRAGKRAQLADLKVGDRVVIDVPAKSSNASLIQIGTAPAAAQAKAIAGPPRKLDIAFQTAPKAPKAGDNTFEVTVKDSTGDPVIDAGVSVVLTMPAMPAMKMPAMRNEVPLKHTGAGKYTGVGQIAARGAWTATISVKENGAEVGQKKVTITAN